MANTHNETSGMPPPLGGEAPTGANYTDATSGLRPEGGPPPPPGPPDFDYALLNGSHISIHMGISLD